MKPSDFAILFCGVILNALAQLGLKAATRVTGPLVSVDGTTWKKGLDLLAVPSLWYALAAYEGELQFGLGEEPARRMDEAEFVRRWSAGGEAVAFFDPGRWDALRRQGLPGRVIAFDDHTVAVSRL